MNRYITHSPQQLFDLPDVIHTASATAQDVERIFNRFAGSDGDVSLPSDTQTGVVGMPEVLPPSSSSEGSGIGDYLPYIIAGGATIVVLWLVLK